uniref:Uncharacterized protein n=1 Tax=Knipowitschia caucasica TaxID=637954 RepID=A0AAV2KBN6_KNICA
MGLQRWWEQDIPVDTAINKGELMTHNLTELIKPESYEVRLIPITRFGEGDSTIRIVTYSANHTVTEEMSRGRSDTLVTADLLLRRRWTEAYGPSSMMLSNQS